MLPPTLSPATTNREASISDVTAHVIDEEVRRVVDSNYARAKGLLETNLAALHRMAEALMRYETIDEQQIKDIMAGQEPRPPQDWDESSPTAGATPSPEADKKPGLGVGTPAGQH